MISTPWTIRLPRSTYSDEVLDFGLSNQDIGVLFAQVSAQRALLDDGLSNNNWPSVDDVGVHVRRTCRGNLGTDGNPRYNQVVLHGRRAEEHTSHSTQGLVACLVGSPWLKPDDHLARDDLFAWDHFGASLPDFRRADFLFFAVLSGAFVCNTPANANPPLCRQGDLYGVGSANVLITGPTSLCATIIIDKVDLLHPTFPVAAHLHIGQASYTGPVIVQLGVPKANGGGKPGTSMMCNNAVSADMITAIRNNPEYFYIDIHGQGTQFGALRGQLF